MKKGSSRASRLKVIYDDSKMPVKTKNQQPTIKKDSLPREKPMAQLR